VALQRGPDGVYVWVIKPDDSAEQRPVVAQLVDENTAIVGKGLNAGERVVVDGASRLDSGAHVIVRTPSPQAAQRAKESR
jgi:multidrug efflux system membrane fusion protein